MIEQDKSKVMWGERPILSWFEGRYARSYVALHPFFRIPGIDPAHCIHGALVLEATDMPEGASFLEWNHEQYQAHLDEKLLGNLDVDEAARLYGKPAGWREICGAASFDNHNALMVGLLSNKHALNTRFHDAKAAERINRYCAAEKLFLPTDNEFQPLMQPGICALFDAYEVQSAIIEDEFEIAERQTVSLSYVKECGITPTSEASAPYSPNAISTIDRSLHICVLFDCFFTLIFEQDHRVPKERIESLFEGFWCTPDTTINWWKEPLQRLVSSSDGKN